MKRFTVICVTLVCCFLLFDFCTKLESESNKNVKVIQTKITVTPIKKQEPIHINELSEKEFWQYITKHFTLEKELVKAIIKVESGGNRKAYSSTGDIGLMQISETYYNAYNKMYKGKYKLSKNKYNARTNIITGCSALRYWKNYQLKNKIRLDDDNYFLNYYNAGFYPQSQAYETKVLDAIKR